MSVPRAACLGALLVLLTLAAAAPPLKAQTPESVEVRQALLQRDQQSAEFSLRLSQSQRMVRAGPGDAVNLDMLQLRERQEQEHLHLQQQQRLGQATNSSEAAAAADRYARESTLQAQHPEWGPRLTPPPPPASVR